MESKVPAFLVGDVLWFCHQLSNRIILPFGSEGNITAKSFGFGKFVVGKVATSSKPRTETPSFSPRKEATCEFATEK